MFRLVHNTSDHHDILVVGELHLLVYEPKGVSDRVQLVSSLITQLLVLILIGITDLATKSLQRLLCVVRISWQSLLFTVVKESTILADKLLP